MAGRGFGKTRTGAEWLSYLARHCPDLFLAIVGATFDDARYVMVEGPSGILAMCFIPSLQPYLAEGFAILDTTPEWFRWAMLASIGASFGLRGFDRFTGRK